MQTSSSQSTNNSNCVLSSEAIDICSGETSSTQIEKSCNLEKSPCPTNLLLPTSATESKSNCKDMSDGVPLPTTAKRAFKSVTLQPSVSSFLKSSIISPLSKKLGSLPESNQIEIGSNWSLPPENILTEWKMDFQSIDNDKDSKISELQMWKYLQHFQKKSLEKSDFNVIWLLSDMDRDNMLDFEEFCIAKVLVLNVLNGIQIPGRVPKGLWPKKYRILAGEEIKSDIVIGAQYSIPVDAWSGRSRNALSRRFSSFFRIPSDLSKSSYVRENNGINMNIAGNNPNGETLVENDPSKKALDNTPPKYIKETIQIHRKILNHFKVEEKERERLEELRLLREQRKVESIPYWREVITSWPKMKSLAKTRQLWWNGFPPSVRGELWELGIGNELNITSELMHIFGAQSKQVLQKESLGREDSAKLIPLDLPRTFPALNFFQKDGPYHQQLRDILEAYVCYRPDIGYVQGMSYLASMMLLNMNTFPAFKFLANLLNRPLHMSFFSMHEKNIQTYFTVYDLFLARYLPKIHKNFTTLAVIHQTYMLDWFVNIRFESTIFNITIIF